MKKKTRILMVDDDTDYADGVRLTLEKAGHRFVRARNREEGLRLVKETRPDLIILDVLMNGRTEGFLFAHQLRSKADYEEFSGIPIIVLTGMHGREETFDHAISPTKPIFGPGDEFLEKPIKPKVLLDAVAQAYPKIKHHTQ